MKNIIVLICIGLLIYSCSSGERPKKQAKSPFAYAMPSHLFFKNMRSFHYNEETRQKQGLSIFRLKKLQNSPSSVPIQPVIYLNWLKDEAYVLFENESKTIVNNTTIQTISPTKDTSNFVLKNNDFLGQQKLAISLLKEHQKSELTFGNDDENMPVFQDQFVRNQALIVIADYMKLTE